MKPVVGQECPTHTDQNSEYERSNLAQNDRIWELLTGKAEALP